MIDRIRAYLAATRQRNLHTPYAIRKSFRQIIRRRRKELNRLTFQVAGLTSAIYMLENELKPLKEVKEKADSHEAQSSGCRAAQIDEEIRCMESRLERWRASADVYTRRADELEWELQTLARREKETIADLIASKHLLELGAVGDLQDSVEEFHRLDEIEQHRQIVRAQVEAVSSSSEYIDMIINPEADNTTRTESRYREFDIG